MALAKSRLSRDKLAIAVLLPYFHIRLDFNLANLSGCPRFCKNAQKLWMINSCESVQCLYWHL